MTNKITDDVLTIYLKGEIDHHASQNIRQEIDELINRTRADKTVLNFRDVSFCDSSGIAIVLGRYKLIKSLGGELELSEVPEKIKKIFIMAGIEKMLKITDKGEKE